MGKQTGQSVNSATRTSSWPYSAARSACPPRRANAFGARASDDDDLVFDSVHEVLLSTSYFPHSDFFRCVSSRNYRARRLRSKEIVTNSADHHLRIVDELRSTTQVNRS
jgi:hypothetical protein